jgi:hypothetical protein
MFRLWRTRSGASHSSRPACLEAARPHSHVSVEGRQLRCYRFSAVQLRFISQSRRLSGDCEHVAARCEPPRPSRGKLDVIDKMDTFFPFFRDAATTTIIGDPQASVGTDAEASTTRHEFLETIQTARDRRNVAHGLGSWVVIPEMLEPHTTVEAYESSINNQNNAGSTERPSEVEYPGRLAIRNSWSRAYSLLALTLDYTRYLHTPLNNVHVDDSSNFLELIERVFSPIRSSRLEQRGFQAEDVVCWGWILAAPTAGIAVSRMQIITNFAKHGQDASPMGALPYFMFTIILRSSVLSGQSLTLLVNILIMRLQQSVATASERPDSTTSMILLVRLIRHARRVAPGQLLAIADLSGTLLKAEYLANPSSPELLERLTSNYNRLLCLLSTPTSQHPYRDVTIQQQAQFKLVRQMASMEPALPVTREGYQALAKVQLAHKKTTAEQDWACTKAGSWPPWRKDKLGITESVEYPGSQSRAAEILGRQMEAGYMQTDWDKAAKILAGWDTDKSPTIQTRFVVPKAPKTWLESLVKSLVGSYSGKKPESTEGFEVWTARIWATRTTREAWSCFCAWEEAWGSKKRRPDPYWAMFSKLAAKLQVTGSGRGHLPGDGREVHPQTMSSNEFLYLSVEPPSFHAFYDKMRLDGIKPGGRLLALLLDHARTQSEGITYLEHSSHTEITKDVMLNAHKYDAAFIRSTLKAVQPAVLVTFFAMLWRTRQGFGKNWYMPTSYAASDISNGSSFVSHSQVSARTYALDLVSRARKTLQISNRVLAVLCRELESRRDLKVLNRQWQTLQKFLNNMVVSEAGSDMDTFYTVASVIEHLYDANPEFRFGLHVSDREECISYGCRLAKQLFIRAVVYSDSLLFEPSQETSENFLPCSKHTYLQRTSASDADTRARWLPYSNESKILEAPSPAALHLLMRVLSRARETRSILRLLQWMDRFSSDLLHQKHQVSNGDRQMRLALCVAAMAVEEDMGTSEPSLAKEIASVRMLVENNAAWGGWPTDHELERYLKRARPSDRKGKQLESM